MRAVGPSGRRSAEVAVALVASAGFFQETAPAVQADDRWRAGIAPEASGQALLESDQQGASLTIAFEGNSLDLIARQGPREGRLLVTHDGRNVPGLLVDDQGRSYVDLYSPEIGWQARLPIARSLGPGQHVLRLTVSEKKLAWESWLNKQGLTREYVERHYHLIFEDFFIPHNGR